MLNKKNRIYFFLPILFLTILTTVPMVNFLRGNFKYESSQKTRLTAFLVIPGVPVFSTDDFFETVVFEVETINGKKLTLKWQELIDKNFENNYIQYVYLRHVFNTRLYMGRVKDNLIIKTIKDSLCIKEFENEKVHSVVYKVSFPFEPDKVKKEIKVDCNE